MGAGSADLKMHQLAAKQHGCFSRAQADEVGVSDQHLSRRTKQGLLKRMGPGVYRITGSHPTYETRVMLAVLIAGPEAAASHRTAAYLHGLMDRPSQIEVVAPRNGKRKTPFVLHLSTDLRPDHLQTVDSIPTTTGERTAIDIGVPHGLGATARVIDEGRRQGKVDLVKAAGLLHEVARRGRNGVGPARRIIAERLDWDQITDSQLEDRFLRLIQNAGLPPPLAQNVVTDSNGTFIARLDFAYPAKRIAIELDSLAFHTDKKSFQTDRQRQNRLILAGWTVLRFTWWDVLAGQEWVLDTVATALRP